MITIEPPGTISVPPQKPGAPYLDSEMWASSEGRPSFNCCKRTPGAPSSRGFIALRWASSEGRPFSSRRTLTLACLALLLATSLQAQSSNWQLTWSDEFNAPNGSPPDPTKWNIITGGKGYGNNELETYTARLSQRAAAKREPRHHRTQRRSHRLRRRPPPLHLRPHQHAAVTSRRRYGRFEARIQLPTGKGIWPAFWLLGDDHETNHWPDCGEIDILETIGASDTMYSTLHGPGYSGAKGISKKFPLPSGESVNNAFHIYAVEWAPNDIKFFFDDHLIVERTPADLPPNTKWVYDHPFYILLNFAVGGNWPGNPDDSTTFPQQMLIDYVRVYSRKPESSKAASNVGCPISRF